ncbi:ribbon-helix-helix domain-containing protein [Undibacterium sp. Ji42W]|uniref:ribbon-helix-helix domain-containing protein n=1 Tax=Undibacterium sp. Ji42W TaxID=3413039 RepID=UPI003BEFD55B
MSSEPTANGMTRRNFFVPDVMYAKLQKRATATGILVSEQLRQALDDYVKKHERTDEPG